MTPCFIQRLGHRQRLPVPSAHKQKITEDLKKFRQQEVIQATLLFKYGLKPFFSPTFVTNVPERNTEIYILLTKDAFIYVD